MKYFFSIFLTPLFLFTLCAEGAFSFSDPELIAQNKICGCDYACTCDPVPETKIPCTKAYNAPLRFSSCYGVFVDASFLYWTSAMQNIEVGTVVNDALDRNITFLDYKYQPTFRIAAGLQIKHDTWQTYIEYTRFHDKVNKKLILDTNESTRFEPYWTNYLAHNTAPLKKMSSHWKLSLDLIDWNLARRYYVGQFLSFKPYIGLRGALINQKLTAKYFVESVMLPLEAQAREVKETTSEERKEHIYLTEEEASAEASKKDSKLKKKRISAKKEINYVQKSYADNESSSWAIGPRFGLDAWWAFCGNLRIFGNVSTGLLYTEYYKIKMKTSDISSEDLTIPTSLKYSLRELRYDSSFSIGMGYEDYVFYDRYHFDFTIGYDFNIFFDQNVFKKTNILYGDLYLHGLTIKLGLDF